LTGAAPIRRAEPVMGTVVSFDVRPGPARRREVFLALAEAKRVLHRVDAVFSTWKKESPVSRLRRGEITIGDAPAEVAEVLERCNEARRLSDGWFDPWAMPGGVDPTGLVKGWAAERALDALAAAGVEGAMVSAGGDVAFRGWPEPGRRWRIGVQSPFDRASIVAVVEPPGAAATSGSYERGDHVLDPRTGRPAAAAVSATVTGSELALADALATGLLACGPPGLEWFASLDGFEAMVIDPDGAMSATSGFPFG
jgi:thiamine biosynthesis lipoprotein